MRIRSLVLALSALAGCSSAPTRTITGQLRTQGYALSNPVVVAESSDHRVFFTHMSKDGSFKLQLPPNVAYRITLANSTRTAGVFTAVARINWPIAVGASRWAQVGAGDTLALGGIYRRGTIPRGGSGGVGIQCDHCGGGGGSDGGASGGDGGDDCKEDDKAKCESGGHDDDCDSDHEHKDDDKCDKDDDADKHDKDCDDHDKGGGDHGDDDGHCGCSSDGGTSGGGGAGGGGGGGVSNPGACVTNSDCAKGETCVNSVCTGGTVP
jgi:hypothetical protein